MLSLDDSDARTADQGRYQVRMEWGAVGARRLAHADVVVVVDVFRDESTVQELAAEAAGTGALVLAGDLRSADAVAAAVLAEQQRRGARTSVALLACGDVDEFGVRFTVEDQLAAGAVADALAARGIDHSSPEAAAATEAFRGLRRAVRHLLSASATGQRMLAHGRAPEVGRASEIDADDTAVVLHPAADLTAR